MLLLCMLSIFHDKQQKIKHDCYSSFNPFNGFSQNTINYFISCPKETTQSIKLSDNANINSISISGETNVFISCLNTMQSKIKLLIYDKPNISFGNHCYFNSIEMYGIPTINLIPNSNITVRNLVMKNSLYSLPINFHHIIYSYNETKRIIRSKNEFSQNTKIYNCSNANLILSEELLFKCDSEQISLKNVDLLDLTITIADSIQFINESSNNEQAEKILDEVISSLSLNFRSKIIFTDFFHFECFEAALETLSFLNLEILMNMTWQKYTKSDSDCVWESESYYSEFEFLKDEFNWLVERTGWRKICFNEEAYLYYKDETNTEIITFSKTTSWLIIGSIVLFIFLLIVASILIAFYKYNYSKSRVENEHSEKND